MNKARLFIRYFIGELASLLIRYYRFYKHEDAIQNYFLAISMKANIKDLFLQSHLIIKRVIYLIGLKIRTSSVNFWNCAQCIIKKKIYIWFNPFNNDDFFLTCSHKLNITMMRVRTIFFICIQLHFKARKVQSSNLDI